MQGQWVPHAGIGKRAGRRFCPHPWEGGLHLPRVPWDSGDHPLVTEPWRSTSSAKNAVCRNMSRSMVRTNGQSSTFCQGPVRGACSPVTEKLLNSFAPQPLLPNLFSPTASLELSWTADTSPEQRCTWQPLPMGKDAPTLSALWTPSKEVTPSTGRATFGVSFCPGPSTAPVQLLYGEKTKQVKDLLFSFSFLAREGGESPRAAAPTTQTTWRRCILRQEKGGRPAETVQCRIYECRNLWLLVGYSHVNIC